jgi:hypothetical protein
LIDLNDSGNGNEETMGHFTVKGNFNEKAPYAVDFTWQFAGAYDVRMEFTGWRESDKGNHQGSLFTFQGGVFGTWKGSNGSGSFAFFPSKEGSGNLILFNSHFLRGSKEVTRGDEQKQ